MTVVCFFYSLWVSVQGVPAKPEVGDLLEGKENKLHGDAAAVIQGTEPMAGRGAG